MEISSDKKQKILDELKKRYPGKFVAEERIFSHVHRGDKIFIGTGCGEPQYLVRALIQYSESHPKAFSMPKFSMSGPSVLPPIRMRNSSRIFGITRSSLAITPALR